MPPVHVGLAVQLQQHVKLPPGVLRQLQLVHERHAVLPGVGQGAQSHQPHFGPKHVAALLNGLAHLLRRQEAPREADVHVDGGGPLRHGNVPDTFPYLGPHMRPLQLNQHRDGDTGRGCCGAGGVKPNVLRAHAGGPVVPAEHSDHRNGEDQNVEGGEDGTFMMTECLAAAKREGGNAWLFFKCVGWLLQGLLMGRHVRWPNQPHVTCFCMKDSHTPSRKRPHPPGAKWKRLRV